MLNQTFCISTKIDTHRATKFYSWKNEHFHLWFIFSWQGGWFKKEKQNKTKPNIKRKQKLNHVSIKARQKKKKESCTVGKGSDEGKKTNKNAFLQCLGPTPLSQEKAPNQSQLADTSSSPCMSIVSHCRMENPGSIFPSGPTDSHSNLTC